VVENVTLNRRLAMAQKRIFDLETDQKKGLKIMSSLKASRLGVFRGCKRLRSRVQNVVMGQRWFSPTTLLPYNSIGA
jgi:hypothetical protein